MKYFHGIRTQKQLTSLLRVTEIHFSINRNIFWNFKVTFVEHYIFQSLTNEFTLILMTIILRTIFFADKTKYPDLVSEKHILYLLTGSSKNLYKTIFDRILLIQKKMFSDQISNYGTVFVQNKTIHSMLAFRCRISL